MIVAITGSIGSGKSTVSNYFKNRGFQVYDTDKMVHAYYKKDSEVYRYLVNEYGRKILNKDLTLNNKKLAKIVFNDYNELDKLEKKVYPILTQEIITIKEKYKDEIVLVEVPLLFEANMENLFDKVIMVDASEKIRHNRLIEKGYQLEDILNREKRQYSNFYKKSKSDIIINNDKDLKDLYTQLKNVERGEFYA